MPSSTRPQIGRTGPGARRAAIRCMVAAWLAAGCAGSSDAPGSVSQTSHPGGSPNGGDPASYGPDVERDVEAVRDATRRFRSLDEAVAAGYPRRVSHCLANPPQGAMGYHHVHPELLDGTIEVERPEILVYELTDAGEYELVGVEYAVPLAGWTDPDPPTVMGQELKPAPDLGIWYLHVWVWRTNPHGLFADWNPNVECRE